MLDRFPCVVMFGLLLAWPRTLYAFPPYRSTDASVADVWVLEARLGIVRARREGDDVDVAAPLARVNLGLPARLELITEAEYSASNAALGDAAAGAKWAPRLKTLCFGLEALALLPVTSAGGAGVEAQALASFYGKPARVHANAGGFVDGRDPAERGLRASLLAELELDGARPGLELFAKRPGGEATELLAGIGSIVELGLFDLRLGIHAGLTAAAPDLVASTWLSTEFALGP